MARASDAGFVVGAEIHFIFENEGRDAAVRCDTGKIAAEFRRRVLKQTREWKFCARRLKAKGLHRSDQETCEECNELSRCFLLFHTS